MIKGVIFDMDGVLIDNRDAHIEAFTRLFKKYGVPFDREKFMPSFGMTNDMIFARQAPELLERYPLEQLSLEKEALYRSIFEESIAPTRGLVDFLKSLKEHGIKIAVGSVGQYEQCQFRIVPLSYCGVLRCDCQRRYDFARKTRSGSLPVGCEIVGIKARRVRRNRGCSRRYRGGTPAGMAAVALATTFSRDRIPDYDILVDDFTQLGYEQVMHLPAFADRPVQVEN